MSRETQQPTPTVGRRPWSATSAFERRWLTPEDKEALEKLAPPCATEAAAEEVAEEATEEAAATDGLVDKVKAVLPNLKLGKLFQSK